MESPIKTGRDDWWQPVGAQEKFWIILAFIWCMILFAMMPLWHFKGGQNPSGIRAKVTPQEFRERTLRFQKEYSIGREKGFHIVEPPPGSHIYMAGEMWRWWPVLKLQTGAEYILHLSALDVNHGFNLAPINLNFQVVPGFDYGLKIVPNQAGEYYVVCNEFCGIGHHRMVGKIIVEDPQ